MLPWWTASPGFAAEGKEFPRPILVPHEFTAVSMAHGYAMVTGEPQVVMVHVNVGTSNGLTGVMNASRANIPLIFTAGRTPITEGEVKGGRNLHIHWAQESFDQASMVREYVKWDYELRCFAQVEKVVDRALNIAMSEPKGPVYLSLPREVLAEEHSEFTYTPARPEALCQTGPGCRGGPPGSRIAEGRGKPAGDHLHGGEEPGGRWRAGEALRVLRPAGHHPHEQSVPEFSHGTPPSPRV